MFVAVCYIVLQCPKRKHPLYWSYHNGWMRAAVRLFVCCHKTPQSRFRLPSRARNKTPGGFIFARLEYLQSGRVALFQCVTLSCSVLRCVAVSQKKASFALIMSYRLDVCCSVLHRDAVCCSVPTESIVCIHSIKTGQHLQIPAPTRCVALRRGVWQWLCHIENGSPDSTCHMGWLRLVGSLKLWVSFAEYSLFCRALLQKRPQHTASRCVAVIVSYRKWISRFHLSRCGAMCCVLQCDAVCCSVLQCAALLLAFVLIIL